MTTFDPTTVREYFNLIKTHVVRPLADTELSNSCYATLLMLCGCIDGLGKLIHPRRNAGAGERFKYFVSRMGPKYDAMKKELWDLRNELAHNALNVVAYLSHVPETSSVHLQKSSSGTQFFVNTQQFFDDFVTAFKQLERDLSTDTTLQQIIQQRLTYCEIPANEFEEWETTPPPPIRFIQN